MLFVDYLQLRQDLIRDLNSSLDVLIGVRQRHETSLVHGRGEVDTTLQHHSVPLAELLGIGLGSFLEVLDRSINEIPTEHTASIVSADGMAVLLSGLDNTINKHLCLALKLLVHTGLAELLHGLDTSSHGKRVARKSTSLVHRSSGGNHLHDVLASTVGANGKTTANHLTHGGNIGGDAKVLLGTTVRNTESSHNLVEDEKGTILLSELADALKELLVGLDETRVSYNGLEDDGGDLVLVVLEDGLDGIKVVVLGAVGGLGGRGGNAGRIGKTKGGNTRSSLNEEGIGVAVVASLELDDLLAVGEGTDKADHTHASLSAGVGETDHLNGGDGINDHLGKVVLKGAGGTEGGSYICRRDDGNGKWVKIDCESVIPVDDIDIS